MDILKEHDAERSTTQTPVALTWTMRRYMESLGEPDLIATVASPDGNFSFGATKAGSLVLPSLIGKNTRNVNSGSDNDSELKQAS